MTGIEGLTLGRYILRRRIAQGGMAEVYLAYDRRVRRQVAVKVLYGRNEPFVRRFEREALAVGALSHNHILPLYDFGEQSPWYYLVMPYVEGGTLRDYLLKRKHLTMEEAASFVDQIASALQYAHDHGVVHRDVKPSNILLRQDGYAYLVDFGLAKAAMGGESLTSIGAMVGTPEYMAPEQSNGLSDQRSDIYSLGVILYQMLTGRVPFTAESPVAISLKHIQITPTSPRELNSEIPQGVEEVILKALAKNPDERYQEAHSLSVAYWKALQQEQANYKADPASHTPPEEATSKTSQEDQQDNTTHSAITRVLPETERHMVHPHVTPALIPLKEKLKPVSFPSAPVATRKRYRYRPTLLALVCLLVLLAALPLGSFWQTLQKHSITPITSAQTPIIQKQPQPDLTATALAQAHIQATLAAESRVQATAGITSSIGAGTILYANDMTTPGGGWIDDGHQCYFSLSGYHVQTFSPHEVAWCYSSQQQYSNVVITAQAQLLRGDIYGITFRLNPKSREFYALELNNSGYYRLVRAQGNNPLNWLTLIDWTHSNAILSGYGSINTFLILTTGPYFSFYINKQLIITDFTDTLYPSGLLGLLVGGDTVSGTEAVFSNVWVFQK